MSDKRHALLEKFPYALPLKSIKRLKWNASSWKHFESCKGKALSRIQLGQVQPKEFTNLLAENELYRFMPDTEKPTKQKTEKNTKKKKWNSIKTFAQFLSEWNDLNIGVLNAPLAWMQKVWQFMRHWLGRRSHEIEIRDRVKSIMLIQLWILRSFPHATNYLNLSIPPHLWLKCFCRLSLV